jgi:hypothetical protein
MRPPIEACSDGVVSRAHEIWMPATAAIVAKHPPMRIAGGVGRHGVLKIGAYLRVSRAM